MKSKSTKKATPERGDTLLISTTSAVRVDLDTIQLDHLRKKYGDEGFYVGADDDVFYAYGTDSVLKANNLPEVSAPGDRYKYLKFLRSNGKATIVKIDTLSRPINYFFLKPSAAPYQPDITDPEGEYKAFFE
ncbi:hypothetical protein [Mucilaginibacter psychrotolerans]|uniref:Uncharacterized protein n=1 Tax=Mucilaginibacter psychrotolerans TaxID=1524096 RepID=A0A4Y8SAF0_9SPHI|nr:hypothetical protein [Mucilaginibacter psychrotolerans]TFF35366.1 hypothetical protein E2R66_19105 [Mucilaginibacter psychrotolerans]